LLQQIIPRQRVSLSFLLSPNRLSRRAGPPSWGWKQIIADPPDERAILAEAARVRTGRNFSALQAVLRGTGEALRKNSG